MDEKKEKRFVDRRLEYTPTPSIQTNLVKDKQQKTNSKRHTSKDVQPKTNKELTMVTVKYFDKCTSALAAHTGSAAAHILVLVLYTRNTLKVYSDYGGTESWNKSVDEPAPAWIEGDRVMCELDCEQGTCTFHLNDKKLDSVATGMQGRAWVPAVSLRNDTESITILWSEYYE